MWSNCTYFLEFGSFSENSQMLNVLQSLISAYQLILLSSKQLTSCGARQCRQYKIPISCRVLVKNYKTKNNYFNDTQFMYRNNSPFYSVFILFHFVRVTYYFNCVFILLYPLLALPSCCVCSFPKNSLLDSFTFSQAFIFLISCIRVKFRPLFWKVYKREFEGNKHFGNGNQPKRCKRPRFCIIFIEKEKLLAKLFYEDTISFHRLHVALTKSETIYCGVNVLLLDTDLC
uniref:Signal peptide protein n=1 Tax=Heterorhabditis bacteriophora TaxID=37862 RepID=A0A1I7W923_HETBA